jgi:cytoskeleton protein RodZ
MGDDQNTVHSPNGEAKIGPVLEKARIERGLTLEEAEQATKIRKRYLAGLEREDYGILPDAVYARGFLKTYANYLGLDGEDLSQRLRSTRRPRRERALNYDAPKNSGFERPLITPGGLAGTEERKVPLATILGVIVAILALLAVIGALYFVGRDAQLSGFERNSAERQEGRLSGTAAREPAAPEGETLTVSVSVSEKPVWVSVLSDGRIAYEQVAQPGFSREFEADRELSVRAGDAGAVSVAINGQNVGSLGASGEVLTRTWTVKAASAS